MNVIIALSGSTAHHLLQAGLVVGAVGALALVVAGAMGLRALRTGGASRREERIALIVGGLLIAIGFVLQIIGNHTAPHR